MDKNNKKELCPWLYNFDGPPTTQEEKFEFKWEYAFESKTQSHTTFKRNLSEISERHIDI